MINKRLAITQPYIFPYINYFHLIEASDKIIFYDDISYITAGWINRNRILLGGKDLLITIPVKGASQNKKTCEVLVLMDEKFKKKTYKQLEHAYCKAPYYNEVMEVICKTFSRPFESISDVAIHSIVEVYRYLGKELVYDRSSECSPETFGMWKSDRLIEITKQQGFSNYVNVIWGEEIHKKDYFSAQGVNLEYLSSLDVSYKQFKNEFVPLLSIVDVLMFNHPDEVKEMMKKFKIE